MPPSQSDDRAASAARLNPNPVVSVRLDRALVERLDALVARTGRSRGFYIRTAIEDALSDLEVQYWGHEAVTRAQEENREFGAMMRDLNDTPSADRRDPGGPGAGERTRLDQLREELGRIDPDISSLGAFGPGSGWRRPGESQGPGRPRPGGGAERPGDRTGRGQRPGNPGRPQWPAEDELPEWPGDIEDFPWGLG